MAQTTAVRVRKMMRARRRRIHFREKGRFKVSLAIMSSEGALRKEINDDFSFSFGGTIIGSGNSIYLNPSDFFRVVVVSIRSCLLLKTLRYHDKYPVSSIVDQGGNNGVERVGRDRTRRAFEREVFILSDIDRKRSSSRIL